MSKRVGFKAHARLLTMLGDQLIKNERIALVELVKNSYDADATRVLVDFIGFDGELHPSTDARIVITDNGDGMPTSVVETAWMNPATPSKAIAKKTKPTTPSGRLLQGEKGIGRFATFKIGSTLSLTTKTIEASDETTLLVDVSMLDEPDSESNTNTEFFLDKIEALIDTSMPSVFTGEGEIASLKGTRLELGSLRSDWGSDLITDAYLDIERLLPVMWTGSGGGRTPEFSVTFFRDGIDMKLSAKRDAGFEATLERAVFHVTEGVFDDQARTFSFRLTGRPEPVVLSIDEEIVRALKPFNDWFLKDKEGKKPPAEVPVEPKCGPFRFEFYIFDFARSAPARYALDKDQRDSLRRHRIYLYRDGVRVYPYGDPDDDWLEIDIARGRESAGRTFSSDQTIGRVMISQAENPNLKDKTNREGLLESGKATGDFKALIQTVLRYLRQHPYEQYAIANRKSRERALEQHRLNAHIEALRTKFDLPASALRQLDELENAIGSERELSSMRLARTEQLAGVGLSIEAASHDLIAAGSEALREGQRIVSELRLLDLMQEVVYSIATTHVDRLQFISERFNDVQGLFVSTRKKQTEQDVVRILRRVRELYKRLHEQSGIEFNVDSGADLRAPSTEAALLQCMVNLVDNATFWLRHSPRAPRQIRAFTPDNTTLVFTDSGPGVRDEDAPYIFEPFYSARGDEGRGLGLYIARENGLRNGFTIDLGKTGDPRELPGATFVVRFGEAKDSDVDS